MAPAPNSGARSKSSMVSTSSDVNGAGPSKRRKQAQSPSGDQSNPVVIEGDEDVEMAVAPPAKLQKSGRQDAKGKGKANQAQQNGQDKSEIARTQAELEEAESRIRALEKQLDDVLMTRDTEMEQLYRALEQANEQEQQDSMARISDLEAQLAQHDPLFKVALSDIGILTRAEADAEKAAMERDLKRYKRLAEDNAKLIEKQREELDATRAELATVRQERDAEIDRSKFLAAKNPPGSATRNGVRKPLIEDTPKRTNAIAFYEDLTDILVLSIKGEKCNIEESEGEEDVLIGCVYTYKDQDDPALTQSITFNLRMCHDFDNSIGELVPSVNYSPREMDKLPPSFVDRLQLIKEPFSFRKEQLQLFLKTMNEQVKLAMASDDEDDAGEDDDDVRIVG
ncbi:hypothetical protein CYLTODRAFT_485693 [Cylindrobasidium torrendii FP15055 ss-10]|uniref:Monopolin complex subunit Csm1/Pcs1 C-terminal domain-containing protein n=1 Tax=Cylindrobasidium torrendii FP15055 ss-10 TaxID=1314674 RepID=A0A0D7BS91_9AGAR|nr:hypothetical protein CYLTODRAFT_485693 [Cylindrobasidium torrendii FP15055 ss-10]